MIKFFCVMISAPGELTFWESVKKVSVLSVTACLIVARKNRYRIALWHALLTCDIINDGMRFYHGLLH